MNNAKFFRSAHQTARAFLTLAWRSVSARKDPGLDECHLDATPLMSLGRASGKRELAVLEVDRD